MMVSCVLEATPLIYIILGAYFSQTKEYRFYVIRIKSAYSLLLASIY